MFFTGKFFECNQIKIYPKDEKHTSFRTPLGVYCLAIMSFGLKNTGATYKRAMSMIFCKYLRIMIEFYMDDLAIKHRKKSDHLRDLRTEFDIIRKTPDKNESHCPF